MSWDNQWQCLNFQECKHAVKKTTISADPKLQRKCKLYFKAVLDYKKHVKQITK